jgi:hypothetical protein
MIVINSLFLIKGMLSSIAINNSLIILKEKIKLYKSKVELGRGEGVMRSPRSQG